MSSRRTWSGRWTGRARACFGNRCGWRSRVGAACRCRSRGFGRASSSVGGGRSMIAVVNKFQEVGEKCVPRCRS